MVLLSHNEWNKLTAIRRNGTEGHCWNKTEHNGQHNRKPRHNETERNVTRSNGFDGQYWKKKCKGGLMLLPHVVHILII